MQLTKTIGALFSRCELVTIKELKAIRIAIDKNYFARALRVVELQLSKVTREIVTRDSFAL